MNKTKASRSRPRTWLLALLGAVLVVAGVTWFRREQRAAWIEKASLDQLAKEAARDESDVEVFIKLGVRAKEAGQWPRAARAFQHACELAPDRIECWVGWARSMYEFADFAASEAILTDFIKRHPDSGRAYLERAALRRDAKRNDRAWQDANEAIRLNPDLGDAYALKGDLCIDMGTFQDAEANFRTARQRMPDSPWPLTGLYHATIEQRSLTRAEEAARELRRRFPEVVEGRFYLGEVLLLGAKNPEQIQEAIRQLKEAETIVKDYPRTSEWHFTLNLLLGRAYFSLKSYDDALKYLTVAVSITPDNPDALFYLGKTYRALGNEKKAAEVLAEHRMVYQNVSYVRKQVALLNSNPDDFTTRLALARWYVARKAYKSARIHLEELVERGQALDVARKELDAVNRELGVSGREAGRGAP